MRHIGNTLAALVLAGSIAAALVAAGVPVAEAQQARAVRAPRYDVELRVQQGGDVLVVETQEIAFQGGPFRKGFRRISLQRLEGVRDVRVEEPGRAYVPGSEAPFTFAVTGPDRDGNVLIEWWFPPTGGPSGVAARTFVVSYLAQGAVRFYPEGDQLRWQALAADRGYPVDRATVTLRLPGDVPEGGWRLAAYPSRLGESASAAASGSTATWQVADVPANQAFEVRAQWPHGLVPGNPPSWQAAADAADWRAENLRPVLNLAFGAAGLLVPLAGGLTILLVWYTRGRDPAIGVVPAELDAAPSDLPPAVAGTVVDEHADVQDVVATVIDLAERGVISLTEVRDPTLVGSQRDFEVARLEPRPTGLRPYEQTVLDSFFRSGDRVRLSQLNWFHHSIPLLQRELHREAVRAGLFTGDPDVVRRRYRKLGTALLVAGLVLGVIACGPGAEYADTLSWPFFGLAVAGALVRFVAPRMPQRTAAGALEAARWRAYARYLAKAPPDAIGLRSAPMGAASPPGPVQVGSRQYAVGRGPSPPGPAARFAGPRQGGRGGEADEVGQVFERVLPYAIALGIERSWVRKFASVGAPAPRWLRTPPVVVVGGPPWGGPWVGPGPGGPWVPGGPWAGGGPPGAPRAPRDGPAGPAGPAGPGGLQDWSDRAAGGLEQASGSLADLLNTVSEVLSRGGGSDWSGGGFGGGGDAGGGGSGGGGSGFE